MIEALLGKFWVKIALAAALVAALLTIYGVWHHHVFQAGVDHQLALDQKKLQHNAVIFNTFTDQMKLWEAPIWDKYVLIVAEGPERTKTVTRIIHDNPTFAVIARPPELARMRAERLDQTRAAANLGPAAASSR